MLLAENRKSYSTISIIIPTYNAGKVLSSLLSSLKKQTIVGEIVIIDSSSDDSACAIAKNYDAKVTTVKKKDFNHGITRNIAALRANGDILVFMTQDALPLNVLSIEKLIAPLVLSEIPASYGRQIPRENATPTEKFARLYNYPEEPIIKSEEQVEEMGIKTFFFSNVFSAIRKKEFLEIGGFPENVIMFEDMLFAAKLIERGYKIAYVPEAKVIHSHHYSLLQHLKRYYQAGVSFQRNPWFMKYAVANREGFAFLNEEIKFLFKEKKYKWMPYAMLEAIFKYTGYKAGLYQHKLPDFISKEAVS